MRAFPADTPFGGDRGGFTFLEIMVALCIVAIVLVSVYRLQSQTIELDTRSRFDTIAPMLAQQKLSETLLDLENAASDSGDFGDDYPGYTWQVTVSKVSSDLLGQVAEEMRQIDVSISFQDDIDTYHLRAYRVLPAK
jgi:general secretion pathway protein I